MCKFDSGGVHGTAHQHDGAGRQIAVDRGVYLGLYPEGDRRGDVMGAGRQWGEQRRRKIGDVIFPGQEGSIQDMGIVIGPYTNPTFNPYFHADVLWRNTNGEAYLWYANVLGSSHSFIGA